MLSYIIKRILIMIPTFLAITVVVFVVINAAPGDPGQSQNMGGSEQADQSGNQREGYRLFKEQYHLDQPILLNFRFMLRADRVEDQLEVIARNMSGTITGETEALHVGDMASSVLSNIINEDYVALQLEMVDPELTDDERADMRVRLQNMGFEEVDPIRPARPPQGDVFDAEERVENWGNVIVPFLMDIAEQYVYLVPEDAEEPWLAGEGYLASEVGLDPEEALQPGVTADVDGVTHQVNDVLTRKVRFLAVQRLSVNSRRRLVIRGQQRGTPEEQALNAEIVSENNMFAEMVYPMDAGDDERRAVVAEWRTWYDANSDRFERNTGQTIRMLFLETRFARYWANLSPIKSLSPLRFGWPDLGSSIRYGRPVLEIIKERVPYSLILSVLSLLLAYFISVPLGILAAVKQNQFADRGIGIFLFILYSLPSFFVATIVQAYLTAAKGVDWFPVSGWRSEDAMSTTLWDGTLDVIWHLVLPVGCLTYGALAVLSRYARTGLLDVIRSDYIRTARAKGLSEFLVIGKHAVRNGMIPILTLLGTTLPFLISGSIVIEYIFVIDGMGKLMYDAILFRDYNIIMGVLLISSILTLIGILLSDISYALVDPRISFD